jgi:hypothetical protein
MKDFFDRTYHDALLEHMRGRSYATLICTGSDGQSAARQMESIATGWQLSAIADPIIIRTHAHTPETSVTGRSIPREDLRPCEELGSALAFGLASGFF